MVNKLVVVTGAGSGIGRATALAFAGGGATVVCADVDGEAAEKTAASCAEQGGPGRAEQCDVTDAAAVAALAERAGAVDVLVNNAGVGMTGHFADMTVDDWRWIRSVNLDGVVHACAAFGPGMIARRSGQIVNVSSGLAYTMRATEGAYVTTKAAVLALSRCLRADWAPHGVGVTAVCPGFVNTPIVGATRYLGSRGDDRTFKVERPDGAVLDGVVVGSGPTVLLSHCWTGSRATWEPVAARLVAAGRRVVLYDQRGHGASTLGPGTPTVDQLGEDLAAVLEAVDARDAVVAGHSMGGMAVQALAVTRPDVLAERVRALVLAGTAGFGVAAGPLAAPARFVTGNRAVERLMAGRLGPALSRGTVGRHPRHSHLVATRDAFLSLPTDVRLQFLIALQA
ncbi:MAG: SDR family NAD(P)-dependent oxidoreductase, partial [Actinobacteria bacterium]|nr:SDR family NAD(P)-dependent oxidoreductase [Actinomycetota bacterium]